MCSKLSEVKTNPHQLGLDWFVAQIKPNQHMIAKRNLERQGVESFMPEIIKGAVSPKAGAPRRGALFPGYIFVSLDLSSSTWAKVGNTRGISRLISFGSKLPYPLPRSFIEDLKERVGPDGLLMPEPEVAVGSVVRVADGPFASFIGQIVKLDDDQRAWLLLEFLGQQSKVGIGVRHLELL